MKKTSIGAMVSGSLSPGDDFVKAIMERYTNMEAYHSFYCRFIFRDTDKIVERKVVEIRREQHVKTEQKKQTEAQKSYTYHNKYTVLKEIINRYNTALQDMINRHGDSAAWQIMSPMLKTILTYYRKNFAMERIREADTQTYYERGFSGVNRYAVLKGIVSSYNYALQEIITRHGDNAAWQVMSPMLKNIFSFYTKSYAYTDRLTLLQERKELSSRVHKISERTVSRMICEAVRRLEGQIGKEKDKSETDTEEVRQLKKKVEEHTKHIEKIEQMQKELTESVTEEKELRKREQLYEQVFGDSEKLEQMRYGLM